ncbi:flagellin [Pantoea sp. KPR_PJ]|uniref:flagellin N-terminal helical domain-containing protein n=1 Tax=Pantoea sp. KPR_PJ TaxID=2738375 RepID=UPI003527FCEB
MLSINTNHSAALAKQAMNNSASVLGEVIERLSSGSRINSAKEDAAGQAISNRMTANINADSVVSRGLSDAISYAQTAEGSLATVSDLLIQAKTLSVQAANGTLSDADRASVNQAYQQILAGIRDISEQTEIFGQYPLATDDPDLPPARLGNVQPIKNRFPVAGQYYTFTSGIVPLAYIPAGATNITITIDSLSQDDDVQLFTRDGKHLAGTPVDGSDPDYTWASKGITDDASATARLLTSGNGFSTGATYDDSQLLQGGASWALSGSATETYNGMTLAYSGDGDRYEDTSTGDNNNGTIRNNPLEQIHLDKVTEDLIVVVVGNGSFTSKLTWGTLPEPEAAPAVPPKQSRPFDVVTSADFGQQMQTDTLAPTPTDLKTLGLKNTTLLNDGDVSVTMKALDAALNKVSGYRSHYGSKINRYESNKAVLAQQSVDTQSARSRIQDADYAQEASRLARTQILQQGQGAVMKIASQSPEAVLALLRG